jgi:hypothetical protein
MTNSRADAANASLEEVLQRCCDKTFVSRVDCVTIDARPDAPYPGEHLVVNCLCRQELGSLGAAGALEILRANIASLLRTMAMKGLRTRGALIRFFCRGLEPNPDGTLPREVLAYAILREAVEVPVERINAEYVASNPYYAHCSDWHAVRSLLGPAPLKMSSGGM